MKTLISYYKEIKEKLQSQLERAETTEQVVKIVQEEINQLSDYSGDYIQGLTPPQARLAIVMLKALNQYTSVLILVKLQDSTANTLEKSNNSANFQSENQLGLTELASNTLSPFNTMVQIENNLKALTSLDYYKQGLLQQIQQNREVVSSLVAGGITGTLAGGYSWGLIGAITGSVIGILVQQTKLSENTSLVSQTTPPKNKLKIGVDIDKLLEHLYQAFQTIDLTIAAYGGTEEKAFKPGLENYLDLLEYLQDLMADALDEQNQLPTAVRRRIEQAATILRRYGIETRVYQPTQEQDADMEAWSMFYFEPSLDPQMIDYITLKHAFVKDDQVLLPGSVIEPASSSAS